MIGAELAWSLHLLRRPAEAKAQLIELLRLDPNYAHAYFVRGLVELATGEHASAIASEEKAIALAGLGEIDAALDQLHRGVDERDMLLAENLFDPVLDPVRGSRRYVELLARMEISTNR